jgi:hypothetical protein
MAELKNKQEEELKMRRQQTNLNMIGYYLSASKEYDT